MEDGVWKKEGGWKGAGAVLEGAGWLDEEDGLALCKLSTIVIFK